MLNSVNISISKRIGRESLWVTNPV